MPANVPAPRNAPPPRSWAGLLTFFTILALCIGVAVWLACQQPRQPPGYNILTGKFKDFGVTRENVLLGLGNGVAMGLVLGTIGGVLVAIIRRMMGKK
jgi:hypothetical protein